MRRSLLAAMVLGASALWGDQDKIAFVAPGVGYEADILLMDRYGHYKTNITRALGEDRDPSWSPDGSKIAFTSNRHRQGPTDRYETDIYVMNADGSGVVNLTNSPAVDQVPVWSPDGTRIAFISDYYLQVMDADGTNREQVFDEPLRPDRPSWSPDGSKVLVSCGCDSDWTTPWNREVYEVDLKKRTRVNLTNDPADDGLPAWSPDGTRVAFVSNRGRQWDVYVMNADGTNQLNLTNDPNEDSWPSWSPDGRWIVFETYRNLMEAMGSDVAYIMDLDIYAMDADGGNQINLTPDMAGASAPAWSPVPVPTVLRVLSWGAAKSGDLGR